MVLGTVLRLREYLFDRSLWRDEASLVFNLQHRGLTGFAKPFVFNQAAPPGFYVGEHVVADALGRSELAYRLIPLMAGIGALVVLLVLVRRELDARTGLITLALCTAAVSLTEYSNEVKQYTIDLLVALLLVVATSVAVRARLDRRSALVVAGAGMVACWFSHTTVFVLVGCGAVLAWSPIRDRDLTRLKRVAAIGTSWVASWATFYFVLAREISDNSFFRRTLPDAFLPLPPHNSVGFHRWAQGWSSIVSMLTGRPSATLILTLLMALGVVWLWRQGRQGVIAIVALPYGAAVTASAFYQYPAVERWMLFILPGLAVFVAAGIVAIADWLRPRTPLLATATVIVIPGLIMSGVLSLFDRPTTIEEMRPLAARMASEIRPGDSAYATVISEPAFDYYVNRDHLHPARIIIGRTDPNDRAALEQELEPLRGRARVWVMTSAFWQPEGHLTPQVTAVLDSLGRRLERYDEPGVSLYLYDLSSNPK